MEIKYTVVKIEIPNDMRSITISKEEHITNMESLFCAEEAIKIRDGYNKELKDYVGTLDYWYEVFVDYV